MHAMCLFICILKTHPGMRTSGSVLENWMTHAAERFNGFPRAELLKLSTLPNDDIAKLRTWHKSFASDGGEAVNLMELSPEAREKVTLLEDLLFDDTAVKKAA